MKSKLTMLIVAGALALGATAQYAMASGGLGNSPPARAVSRKAAVGSLTVTKNAVTRARATKVAPKAAVPSHTILKGAKNNF